MLNKSYLRFNRGVFRDLKQLFKSGAMAQRRAEFIKWRTEVAADQISKIARTEHGMR